MFYEYFHGDNGAGLGASHQTGWTGLIARSLDLFARGDAATWLGGSGPRVSARMIVSRWLECSGHQVARCRKHVDFRPRQPPRLADRQTANGDRPILNIRPSGQRSISPQYVRSHRRSGAALGPSPYAAGDALRPASTLTRGSA